jgi:predicted nucleotidyltransferase
VNHDQLLWEQVASHPYPLVFATVSGAHLYGFPSPDSDFDLRGAYVLPLDEAVGLWKGPETIEKNRTVDGIEMDYVTHEVKKFFRLVLKANGYVLEQIFSPLIVQTSNVHDELKEIARECITRHHCHHYIGFALNQRKLPEKESPRRIKPVLYMFRVLLTGIHLMKTGEVEANLRVLQQEAKVPFIDDLIARKTAETENSALTQRETDWVDAEFARLLQMLQQAAQVSLLPDFPRGSKGLNGLLIRLRTGETVLRPVRKKLN